MSELAPIALFTFKRPQHTKRTLETLAANPEFERSPLHIFCDGARRAGEQGEVDEVRELVRQWPHPAKHISFAAQNQGLSKSIRAGVTELCERYGRVIVVEDDLVLSPIFLRYMNDALSRYENCIDVMQISGHNFPLNAEVPHEAFFLRLTTSWGWATWKRAWIRRSQDKRDAEDVTATIASRYAFDFGGTYPFSRMLTDQIRGKNDSWAVWWYLNVYKAAGLTLFPAKSLVQNGGFDGSGTHGLNSQKQTNEVSLKAIVSFPDEIKESALGRAAVRNFLIRDRSWRRYLKDTFFRIFG
jgi:hypothetical protein